MEESYEGEYGYGQFETQGFGESYGEHGTEFSYEKVEYGSDFDADQIFINYGETQQQGFEGGSEGESEGGQEGSEGEWGEGWEGSEGSERSSIDFGELSEGLYTGRLPSDWGRVGGGRDVPDIFKNITLYAKTEKEKLHELFIKALNSNFFDLDSEEDKNTFLGFLSNDLEDFPGIVHMNIPLLTAASYYFFYASKKDVFLKRDIKSFLNNREKDKKIKTDRADFIRYLRFVHRYIGYSRGKITYSEEGSD